MERLISLVTAIKTFEAAITSAESGISKQSVDFIDRVWIEQRIYRLEEEIYDQSEARSGMESGLELLAEFEWEA